MPSSTHDIDLCTWFQLGMDNIIEITIHSAHHHLMHDDDPP
jgi:hypothetical protein